VLTENSVRSENTGVPTIREIMVATTMSTLFRVEESAVSCRLSLAVSAVSSFVPG
jgi:hypothetical protein